jgi:hypothetical protein
MQSGAGMSQLHSHYRQTLETLYRGHEPMLRRWLQRCFPRTPPALVRDAVADAFLDALQEPRSLVTALEQSGEPALYRCLKQAAWRRLRGHLRKSSTRCEVNGCAAEPRDASTPESIYRSREILVRVFGLIDEAAARHGGRRCDALRSALHARLGGGTDAEVARAHGVPREYLNRARRWIASQLHAHAAL